MSDPERTDKAQTHLRPSQTWFLWAMALAVIGMFAFVILPYVDPNPPKLSGDALPALDLEVISAPEAAGDLLRLSDLKGKPLVVDFWASWCQPCRAQSKVLSQAADEWGDEVNVLGVATSDDLQSARQFLRQENPSYVNVFDENGELARDVGVENLPTVLIVDPQGVIRERHSRLLSLQELDAMVRPLLP